MAFLNRVQLIGYVGDDPKSGATAGGTPWVNLRLATTERYKTKAGEQKELTQWHNLTAYRGLAEVMSKHVKKGAHLLVEGKLNHRQWDDAEGDTHYATEILLDTFQFLDKKKEEAEKVEREATEQKAKAAKKPRKAATPAPLDDGDIPF